MITAEQIKEVKQRLDALEGYLSIVEKRSSVEEEEKQMHEATFWDDPKKAESFLKNINKKKVWVTAYDDVASSIEDLLVLEDFLAEGEVEEAEVNAQYEVSIEKVEGLEFKNMLSGEEDNLSAVMTINPGAGGTESQDWAEMLMRMYIMWGEKNGMKVKELDFHVLLSDLFYEGARAFEINSNKTRLF